MPTATYDRFLQQLNARGRDKADGFDRSHFDGLAPEERPEVLRRLRQAILAGDSTAVNGVVYLDRSAAPAVLTALLADLPPGSDVRPHLLNALWTIERDARWQDALARELDAALDRAPAIQRTLIINFLRGTPPNPNLVPVLREYVHDEANGDNRMEGAKLALYWAGAAPSLALAYREHEPLMRALESRRFFGRGSALAELDRLLEAAA